MHVLILSNFVSVFFLSRRYCKVDTASLKFRSPRFFTISVTLSFVFYFSVALYIFYIDTFVVVAPTEKGVAHECQNNILLSFYFLFCFFCILAALML